MNGIYVIKMGYMNNLGLISWNKYFDGYFTEKHTADKFLEDNGFINKLGIYYRPSSLTSIGEDVAIVNMISVVTRNSERTI